MKLPIPIVYLICGVSGSGKTWICKQLKDKFTYVPHDEHFKDFTSAILYRACVAKPIITECPFAERIIKENLEKFGLEVIPIFVITPPDIVAKQYKAREGKDLPKAAYTRASTIINRAKEWGAFHGSAEKVLKHLENC